jgi:hypothetical protein
MQVRVKKFLASRLNSIPEKVSLNKKNIIPKKQIKQPKGVKPKMRQRKLRSSVHW